MLHCLRKRGWCVSICLWLLLVMQPYPCCCCEQGYQHMLKYMLEDVVAQMQHLGITSQELTWASGALATPGAEHIITNHTFCSLFMDPGPPVPVMLLIGR